MGADGDGLRLKENLKPFLVSLGVNFTDLGVFGEESENLGKDYVDVAREVSEKIYETGGGGLIVSDTGIGLSMVANEKKGIRAALVVTPVMAKLARANNNANLLCLGKDFVDENLAREIVRVFLETDFDVAKHQHFVDRYHQNG